MASKKGELKYCDFGKFVSQLYDLKIRGVDPIDVIMIFCPTASDFPEYFKDNLKRNVTINNVQKLKKILGYSTISREDLLREIYKDVKNRRTELNIPIIYL
jgi:hypothetical protein